MSQISFFDGKHPYKITNKIRLIELFAGIGAQAKALERLQDEGLCEFEHYRICEFDKYAVKSYNAIHGTDFETSDITKITADDLSITETDKYTYILTYSFPCTDLSLAGKQEGMAKGSGTRSGLLWEVERLLNECTELPQVLVMENVPQVICADFYKWCEFLESKGYKNYYQLMNAKNYGVPQNRNRCFMVSLLGDYYYEFPEPFELTKRLKDVLEDKVDKKYYLSEKGIKYVKKRLEKHIATECQQIGELQGGIYDCGFEHIKRVYGVDGVSPTLDTMQGGGKGVKILDEFLAYDEQNGYIRTDGTVGTITTDGSSPKHNNRIIEPKMAEVIGGVGEKKSNNGTQFYLQDRIYDGDIGISVCTAFNPNYVDNNLKIRKLTPKECWRLMDFDDEDFEKARKVNSDSQLYKQAGNSIVVNCLYLIFKQLLRKVGD